MLDLKPLTLVLGPVAGAALGLVLQAAGFDANICWTAAITLTTAVWWVFESIPIPAASLLPFAALPLAGVLTHQQAAAALGNPVILLLMGAFMLSKALEKSGVHERFALGMIRVVGGRGGARLVLAFMLTAAFISMWVSNTATVLMLTPMALALLGRSTEPRLAVPVLLAIAYGASIGGMGTLIGTPPNVIFAGIYSQETGQQFGFLRWMTIGLPIVAVAVPLAALWLARHLRGSSPIAMDNPGPWRPAEVRVLVVFGLTVIAWITQTEPHGGWTRMLGVDPGSDATVALAGVVLMFLVSDGQGGRLLDWPAAGSIPWGVLLLFAGGICLAAGFMASGLSSVIGEALAGFSALHPLLLVLAICLVVTFLTEITSNTAVATLMMPVMAAAAFATGLPPELLMIPAAISASCAFMLPVATAPNAIVYATGQVTIARMVREGLALNLLLAGIVTTAVYLLVGRP
ncbi:MAG: SLC13 family permease [Steroidobacteraceae bacterium]|nr:SLC13 family permease [Steroidobacteraceae bacterium]